MPRGKRPRTLDLMKACYEMLAQVHPARVRAVCYPLFIQGVLPSMAKMQTNRVSTQLVQAREAGEIPWHWVVDATRRAVHSRIAPLLIDAHCTLAAGQLCSAEIRHAACV